MDKLELLAIKYSNKVANGFDMADIEMLSRICKAMKKADNKLVCLVAAEKAINSDLKRISVCLVERATMALVLVKSYFVSSTFEAKDLLAAEYSDALSCDSDLLVMKY